MGIESASLYYGLPGATVQEIEIETQLNTDGGAGYGPYIRPDGRFLRKVYPEEGAVFYDTPDTGEARSFSVYKETYDNGSSRTYTRASPFSFPIMTESGDVSKAKRVDSQEVMNPYLASDITSAATFSGTWVSAMGGGFGDIGIPANDPKTNSRLTHGTKVYGTASGIYFPSAGVGDTPSSGCRVKKTRYRVKYAKHGGVGGGIRLKILKHRLNPGKAHNIAVAFNMHGLSNFPTGTARSGKNVGIDDWSYTIGKVGQIVDPSIDGPDFEFGGYSIGNRACINTLNGSSTKLDNPGLFMMFSGSTVQTIDIPIPWDHSQIGQYEYTSWTELPDSGWDTTFYIFMFDYPARHLGE